MTNTTSDTTRTRIETTVRLIAGTIAAYQNCVTAGNETWRVRHAETVEQLAKDVLPHGSGFDSGTTVDLDASRPNRLVLTTAFHHMNDGGYYNGWTEHQIIVTPDLVSGFDVRVTGRNRNDIKEYIAETFHHVLGGRCEQTYSTETETNRFRLLTEFSVTRSVG